jgi:hypothetical protein
LNYSTQLIYLNYGSVAWILSFSGLHIELRIDTD